MGQSYDFGVPQKRSWFMGVGMGRFAGLATGVLIGGACFFMQIYPGMFVAFAFAAAWSFMPIGDRVMWEWAEPVYHHLFMKKEDRLFVAEKILPRLGEKTRDVRIKSVPELRHIKFRPYLDSYGVGYGVAVEGSGAKVTHTAVFEVDGDSRFNVADWEEQDNAIANWGRVLDGTASTRGKVKRVQIVERAIPHSGELQYQWMDKNRPDEDNPLLEDYESLVRQASLVATSHHVYVAIQVAVDSKDQKKALEESSNEFRNFARNLEESNFAAKPLGAKEMAILMRHFSDPLETIKDVARKKAPPSLKAIGPRARKIHFDYIEMEGTYQRFFFVKAFPRTPVAADWLSPLLLTPVANAIRTVSMTLEPVPFRNALREVQQARTAAEATTKQREKLGFNTNAVHSREMQDIDNREWELAAGHAEHRICGIIGVSATTKEDLDTASVAIQDIAGMARLDLQGFQGHEADAWAATLPLCQVRFKTL